MLSVRVEKNHLFKTLLMQQYHQKLNENIESTKDCWLHHQIQPCTCANRTLEQSRGTLSFDIYSSSNFPRKASSRKKLFRPSMEQVVLSMPSSCLHWLNYWLHCRYSARANIHVPQLVSCIRNGKILHSGTNHCQDQKNNQLQGHNNTTVPIGGKFE